MKIIDWNSAWESEVRCGIKYIDDAAKGFGPGHMTGVFANVGSLKSTTLLNMAANIHMDDKQIMYVSPDMTAYEIVEKLNIRKSTLYKLSGFHIIDEFVQNNIIERILHTAQSGNISTVFIDSLMLISTGTYGTCLNRTETHDFCNKMREMGLQFGFNIVVSYPVGRYGVTPFDIMIELDLAFEQSYDVDSQALNINTVKNRRSGVEKSWGRLKVDTSKCLVEG